MECNTNYCVVSVLDSARCEECRIPESNITAGSSRYALQTAFSRNKILHTTPVRKTETDDLQLQDVLKSHQEYWTDMISRTASPSEDSGSGDQGICRQSDPAKQNAHLKEGVWNSKCEIVITKGDRKDLQKKKVVVKKTSDTSKEEIVNSKQKSNVNNQNKVVAKRTKKKSVDNGKEKIVQNEKGKRKRNEPITQKENVQKNRSNKKIFNKGKRRYDKKRKVVAKVKKRMMDRKQDMVKKGKNKNGLSVPKVDKVDDNRERCRLCDFRFNSKEELDVHRTECAETRVIICKLCGRGWCSETELLNHISDHLANETKQTLDYLCTLGAIKVSSSLGPDTMLEHHNNYICMLCGKWFNRKSNCEKHLYTHGEKKLCCTKCDRKYAMEKHLTEHMKMHTEAYILECTCPICDKILAKKSNLKHHIQHRHTDLPHECKICLMVFKQKDLYCKHIKAHFSDEEKANAYLSGPKKEFISNNICLKCGQNFNQRANLKRHEKKHLEHNTSYLCTECGKGFSTRVSLGIHLRAHKGEKPYSCDKCGMKFGDGSTRNRHIKRIHNKELMEHMCEKCGKGCMNLSELTIHMRTHTGERPYKCDQCGRTFLTNGALTQHKKSHTENFQCSYCFKRLATSKSLKIHIRIHTDERPYSCAQCGKTFKQSQQVKNHMVMHTGDVPYHCEVCGKGFAYYSSLFSHTKTH